MGIYFRCLVSTTILKLEKGRRSRQQEGSAPMDASLLAEKVADKQAKGQNKTKRRQQHNSEPAKIIAALKVEGTRSRSLRSQLCVCRRSTAGNGSIGTAQRTIPGFWIYLEKLWF